jgi:hypothetical protein
LKNQFKTILGFGNVCIDFCRKTFKSWKKKSPLMTNSVSRLILIISNIHFLFSSTNYAN